MCDVCVASAAITHGRTNHQWSEPGKRLAGLQIQWNDGPKVQYRRRRVLDARTHESYGFQRRRFHWPVHPTVYVIARGRAEGAGSYKLRRLGEAWPSRWRVVPNLATEFGALGLDVRWERLSPAMRNYLVGRAKKVPTWDQIDKSVQNWMRKRWRARLLRRGGRRARKASRA